MKQRFLNELQSAGNGIEEFVTRMGGNENFVVIMMKKFLSDPTFQNLQDAVMNMDYEDIESQAHTLKGVALNLGLNSLSSLSKELQIAAKSHNEDLVHACNETVKAEYENIIRMIEKE